MADDIYITRKTARKALDLIPEGEGDPLVKTFFNQLIGALDSAQGEAGDDSDAAFTINIKGEPLT